MIGIFADVNANALCSCFIIANAIICEGEVVGFTQDAYAISFIFVAIVENLIILKGISMSAPWVRIRCGRVCLHCRCAMNGC